MPLYIENICSLVKIFQDLRSKKLAKYIRGWMNYQAYLNTTGLYPCLMNGSRDGLCYSLATQTGMTNKWLAKQGLVSIKEL
jgi:hypothetical protein